MKLIIAIVEDDMVFDIEKALIAQDFRATKLNSTGGFLRKGNTTMLIGVRDEQVSKVNDIIQSISQNRAKEMDELHQNRANANIFVLNMSDFYQV